MFPADPVEDKVPEMQRKTDWTSCVDMNFLSGTCKLHSYMRDPKKRCYRLCSTVHDKAKSLLYTGYAALCITGCQRLAAVAMRSAVFLARSSAGCCVSAIHNVPNTPNAFARETSWPPSEHSNMITHVVQQNCAYRICIESARKPCKPREPSFQA